MKIPSLSALLSCCALERASPYPSAIRGGGGSFSFNDDFGEARGGVLLVLTAVCVGSDLVWGRGG